MEIVLPFTFMKDGVNLSDSGERSKADCTRLVLLLKVLKPLLGTHAGNVRRAHVFKFQFEINGKR